MSPSLLLLALASLPGTSSDALHGILGRFLPPANGQTITLDTDLQAFPLLDGSTPDAPVMEVRGGVFPFTDIVLPAGVILKAVGDHPLVLGATGSVQIAGEIRLDGGRGRNEMAYDSALFSLPGGVGVAGGGRGGEGHPIVFFPPQPSRDHVVSPSRGGDGFGPGNRERDGGQGGQCGTYDNPDAVTGEYATDREISCSELTSRHHNTFNVDPMTGQNYPQGYETPGGGGGSFLTSGRTSAPGVGNVIADGMGGYIAGAVTELAAGASGPRPFRDADPGNDFIGFLGELKDVIGGQGGGAGGSSLDGYHCGDWCLDDDDPSNDGFCQNEFGGMFQSSVGDARGGSGGAGGGALLIQALGGIDIQSTAVLSARGGTGGGGEIVGCSGWSGAGGAGSGGALILRSNSSVHVQTGAVLDVRGGRWQPATAFRGYSFPCDRLNRGGLGAGEVPGDGGRGGDGIVQLQAPPGRRAGVSSPHSIQPLSSWSDPENQLHPALLLPPSAPSAWFELRPSLHRFAAGSSAPEAWLTTLLQLPAAPAEETGFEFQGGDAMAPGSREVDPHSVTPWSHDPAIAKGRAFVRYRLTPMGE